MLPIDSVSSNKHAIDQCTNTLTEEPNNLEEMGMRGTRRNDGGNRKVAQKGVWEFLL